MKIPDAAVHAAMRIASRAFDSLAAARRIQTDTWAVLAAVPRRGELNDLGELFARARTFPWLELDPSIESAVPIILELRPSPASRRLIVALPSASETIEVDLFDRGNEPSKLAIAVVRRWATELVELGEGLFGRTAGDAPPASDEVMASEVELEFYGLLRDAYRRSKGMKGAELVAKLIKRFNVHGSTLTLMKKRLNAALAGKGWEISVSRRIGYHLARIDSP